MGITGVIRPPPEIRAVADRTASYVAKNGRAFESRIIKSEKGKTPKFAFLQPTSPFHAYYEDKIQFYENGGDDKQEEKQAAGNDKAKTPATKVAPSQEASKVAVRKKEKTQKASAIDPIAKALLAQRAKISKSKAARKEQQSDNKDGQVDNAPVPALVSIPPPPPLDLVTIVAPANVPPSQIEIIQLVAQFSALDGKGGPFLHQLSVREWNNPDFAFCQPRHAHFAYFSALVDAYRHILGTWTNSANTGGKSSDKATEKETSAKLADRVQHALEEAAYRAECEREFDKQTAEKEDGEIVAIDWHDFVVVETIDFPADEKVELAMLPPPPPPPSTTSAPVAKIAENTMEESDEDEEETIRVVPSYTPKVVAPSNPQNARAIDPITGKSVSVADMPEHMRIQLLDPKWAEERKKFQDKQKDSNLVGGDDIVSNISRFTQARGDLFGKSEQEILSKKRDVPSGESRPAQPYPQPTADQAYPLPGPPGMAQGYPQALSEPAAKRMRVEPPGSGMPLPPPPPPPPMASIPRAPPPPPPINNASIPPPPADPMADVMFPSATEPSSASGDTNKLLPEAEFAASLGKPEVTLQIRIPNDPSQMAWNFYGQILSLTVNVMSKVKEVKNDLSRLHLNSMPVNKIQFKVPSAGFLKDSMTLASLNIGPTATLDMIPKTRGGRK